MFWGVFQNDSSEVDSSNLDFFSNLGRIDCCCKGMVEDPSLKDNVLDISG